MRLRVPPFQSQGAESIDSGKIAQPLRGRLAFWFHIGLLSRLPARSHNSSYRCEMNLEMLANLTVAIVPRIVRFQHRLVALFMCSLNMRKRRRRPAPLHQRDVDVIALPIQFSLHPLNESLVSQIANGSSRTTLSL